VKVRGTELLIFRDRLVGKLAKQRQCIRLAVRCFHHHEDGSSDQRQVNQIVQVGAGDAAKDVPHHLILDQVGHEEVQSLKAVEARRFVMAEAVAGQDDDRRNPAHIRDVAQDGGRTRRNAGQDVAGLRARRYGCGTRAGGGIDWLLRAATPAEGVGLANLVPALAAKRHLSIHTLDESGMFLQVSGYAVIRSRVCEDSWR